MRLAGVTFEEVPSNNPDVSPTCASLLSVSYAALACAVSELTRMSWPPLMCRLWCSLFAANLPLVQLGDDYVASTNAIFTYVGNKVRHRVETTTHRSITKRTV